MAVAVWTSFQQIADTNGVPYGGAKVNVYAAGTTTPLTLYSDAALSAQVANPIVCDAAGQHAMRYIATASYKTTVTTSTGSPLTSWSKDNIDPGVAVGSGALPVANGGTGATSAGSARTNLGAAAESTVTSIASDVTTLQGYHTGTSAMPLANGTTAQRSGSPADYNIRGNTTLGSPELYLGGTWSKLSIAPPVAGGFKNLVLQNNSGTPNSQIDIDADAVTVETTAGVAYRLDSINLTIVCSTTGANALDAGALANSTWYYAYVIFNPATGTTAGLMSSSSTSPTMPSGYTAKAMFGAFITDGSANFKRIIQKGRRAQYVVGTNPTLVPVIANGVAGTYSATSPVLAAVSVTAIFPTSVCSRVGIIVTESYGGGSVSGVLVAPNTGYGGTNNGPTGSAGQAWPGWVGAISCSGYTEFLLEATTVAWAASAAGGAISGLNWDVNI